MSIPVKRAITAGIAAATIAASGFALAASNGSAAAAPLPARTAARTTAPAAAPTLHTRRIIAIQTASHSVGRFGFIGQDTDRRRSDRALIGYDTISGHFFPKTQTVKIHVAVGLRGGVLLARFHQSGNSTSFTGKITGGAGKYAGATGTISGHSRSQNSSRTFVTIRYIL